MAKDHETFISSVVGTNSSRGGLSMANMKTLVSWIALTLFILSSPRAQAQTRPVSIGVNAGWEHRFALQAHIGWSRLSISWDSINPAPGVWDFSVVDSGVNEALANGQQILGILQYPPQWVGGGPNANIPPRSTVEWSEFVRRVAQHYRGKVAAYEIWNEPDQKSTAKHGIGWGRNIEEPPLYVDFVHAAAVEIRAQAPGTLVVAPAFESRNTGDGVDNRKRRILQQIQAAYYPDGPGYSFIDVISVHNNAHDTEPSRTMGWRLNFENLAYVWNHAPSLRTAPVWVTEYGWRSDKVGEAGQREKICNVTKIYTAILEAAYTRLYDWDVRRAFIYVLKGDSTRGIFRDDNSPKPVVTQYLQVLPYPATQDPVSGYPSCSGTSAASLAAAGSSRQLGEDEVSAAFAALGLLDPRSALPAELSLLYAESSSDGRSLDLAFGDSAGTVLNISVSPASAENQKRRLLTDAGMAWTSGALHLAVSGMRSGLPLGKGFLRSLASGVDPSFSRACMIESVRSDEGAVRRLGLSPPTAPPGFRKTAALIELTSPTKGCGTQTAKDSPVIDFTWTFANAAGEIIRAGIYRYGDDSGAPSIGPRSLHWSDGEGHRYWVAADVPEMTADVEEALYRVARSMDPEFGQ